MDKMSNVKGIDSVYTLLNKIEEVLDIAKPTLSAGVVKVQKDDIYELIKNIRLSMPQEIKEAQRVLHDSENIIKKSRKQAEGIIATANQLKDNAIQEHDITIAAKEEAEIIVSEAEADATDFELNAINYLDGIFAEASESIQSFAQEASDRFDDFMAYIDSEISRINRERDKLKGYAEDIRNGVYDEEDYEAADVDSYDDDIE